MNRPLPGTQRHRAILGAVLEAYADDDSIQTIGVFGSLARPDGDESSDIDLDVTVRADALASAMARIQHLVERLNGAGFPVLLVAFDGPASAEILFDSLDRVDITLHLPEDSKAEVLRDLILVRGSWDGLPAAGAPAIAPGAMDARMRRLHEKFPILAVGVAVSLRRGRLWNAIALLAAMRESVMEIYGLARGDTLPVRYFMQHADAGLQRSLGETLATYEARSIAAGLERLIDLYRAACGRLSDGKLSVTEAQLAVFDRIVARLSKLE